MKKLTLDVAMLAVQSFQTDEAAGCTPAEFAATRPQVCDPFTLPPRC